MLIVPEISHTEQVHPEGSPQRGRVYPSLVYTASGRSNRPMGGIRRLFFALLFPPPLAAAATNPWSRSTDPPHS
ncbi:hypothetical protein COCSADRAFT_259451 [Bipolaris sorokiniana ND90Pr]|uniref:Uncharacterized protein n=1 Tax=Cochliobolus sativus (strain ND90Pr / ATCC 201652) TaxID=665912 RepID=M2RUD1_COCSN|nr:uncharacterized protein COCSADRAFT_259451 [Bipolaris sorokiniana ND90Pr]EMD58773.1 hypothetical protein COCSADRAFT_259451 [Bipolaris sorokiniana ND90Pr]